MAFHVAHLSGLMHCLWSLGWSVPGVTPSSSCNDGCAFIPLELPLASAWMAPAPYLSVNVLIFVCFRFWPKVGKL